MSEPRHEAAANTGAPVPLSPWLGVVRALRTTIIVWALIGGVILLLLAVMTAGSAVSNILFRAPFAPDYELMRHFVAIAVFAFLPFCQLTGANVTVDIFTERMGARAKAVMALLGTALALAFAALLLVQMWDGWFSYMDFVEVTPVLKLPLWTAFPPILLSLALLFAAAAITAAEALRAVRTPQRAAPARAA